MVSPPPPRPCSSKTALAILPMPPPLRQCATGGFRPHCSSAGYPTLALQVWTSSLVERLLSRPAIATWSASACACNSFAPCGPEPSYQGYGYALCSWQQKPLRRLLDHIPRFEGGADPIEGLGNSL